MSDYLCPNCGHSDLAPGRCPNCGELLEALAVDDQGRVKKEKVAPAHDDEDLFDDEDLEDEVVDLDDVEEE